ncbi:MAG: lactonase family protein [Archangiaceae bacterium]|nr:lactonase family protein [Archangiaceae bacterium]
MRRLGLVLFLACCGAPESGLDAGAGGDAGLAGGGAAAGGSSVGGGTAAGGGASAGGSGAGGGTAGGGAMAGGSGGAGGGAGGGASGGSAGGVAGRQFAYVGSGNGNIYVFKVEPADAGVSARGLVSAGVNPSFLAVHPSKRYLYAVNESSAGAVSAFAIDQASGALTFINRTTGVGNGPAHLSVDPTGRYVMVANYGGGTVSVVPILDGGAVGPVTSPRSPGMNAHQIISDRSGRNVFVPCLGSDLVAQYDFDGGLTPKSPASYSTASGAGPRHLDLHPNGQWAYLINETDRTLSALQVTDGKLTHRQTLSTVPAGFSSGSTAEVFVHPAGHSVYGSNRGHDSIVHFHLDGGLMTWGGTTSTGGSMPRSFGLSPDGRLLLVANQSSNTLVAMRIDPVTGALTSLGPVASVPGGPAYVGIVELP